ncbi:peptidoglycan D,D-transpeptidase FtsI family protein [Herbaspirillum sp. CF444]|uniref:peptidoglycan D,D-transpeptidase FtsI family protein n=1 Tax=Herbaspirillum sp. CF444 TaxID=1144319 RepID=UPI0003183D59|nr:penicillin-binding protein 2 [Herbaspirillum sp. CF444]
MPFSASPLLSRQLPEWRSKLVLFLFFSAFVLLALRGLWLQSIASHFLQEQGAIHYERTIDFPSTRGKIVDRNGEILAASIPVKSVWAIPGDTRSSPAWKLKRLAQLLDLTEEEMRRKLSSDRNFVYLKHQVTPDRSKEIQHLHITGLFTSDEFKRFYPEGEAIAHVIGFTNAQDAGQDGLELAYQSSLVGKPGIHHIIRDRLGQLAEDVEPMVRPKDGEDLVLSLDRNIQHVVFSELQATIEKFEAKAGSAIVLDSETGEILALANYPSYDPNNRGALAGNALRNRAIIDTFEPGSTFKPFTLSLALDTELVTPETVVSTSPGKMAIGKWVIHDSSVHGNLTVAEVIQKSSNIGTAKIALKMPAQQIWEELVKFGFGQRPDIEFPGVAAGRVRPYESWTPIEQATISYGHGVSVSLLQLAHAYMVFARNGDQIPISFRKIRQPPPRQQIVSPKTAAQMRQMLEAVVSSHGTATKAQLLNYRAGGKTGTSYKIEKGKYVKKYISSFVGIAPISHPRIVTAIMIDEPTTGSHFGGSVAAPLFSKITAYTLHALGVAPDSTIESAQSN